MKSVSIIYKKGSRQIHSEKAPNHRGKKSIEEYYSKMSDREGKKQQILERIRYQTSLAAQNRDKQRIYSSLNIHSIGTPKPLQSHKSIEKQKITQMKVKKVQFRLTQKNFFSLKLPEHNENHMIQQIKLRNKDLGKHSNLKILSKIKNIKQTTIVLSIDFILNQYSFWGDEQIEDGAVKHWKSLMPLANIIWLVKRQKSSRKLQSFARLNKLRIDGIIQVDVALKQSPYILYDNLERTLKLQKRQKLLIVNSLKGGNINYLSEMQFKSTLPLISHQKTFIHFVKIEMKEKNRFSSALKVLTKQLPDPTDINSIINQEKKRQILSKYNFFDPKESEIDPYEELEKIRIKLCKQFDQRIGLATKIEGDSVQYLIGDMLKRNYSLFKQLCEMQKVKKFSPVHRKTNKPYHRPVYIWQI